MENNQNESIGNQSEKEQEDNGGVDVDAEPEAGAEESEFQGVEK